MRDAHEILDLCAAEEQSYNNLYYFMQTNFDTDTVRNYYLVRRYLRRAYERSCWIIKDIFAEMEALDDFPENPDKYELMPDDLPF